MCIAKFGNDLAVSWMQDRLIKKGTLYPYFSLEVKSESFLWLLNIHVMKILDTYEGLHQTCSIVSRVTVSRMNKVPWTKHWEETIQWMCFLVFMFNRSFCIIKTHDPHSPLSVPCLYQPHKSQSVNENMLFFTHNKTNKQLTNKLTNKQTVICLSYHYMCFCYLYFQKQTKNK